MKVLYVEDSAADADLARRALQRSLSEIELQVATSLAMARGVLASQGPFDGLLLDLDLPDGSGLELLAEVRQQALALPVVMLTGSGDHNAVAVAIRAGADDYLIKQGDYLKRLPIRLAEAIRRKDDHGRMAKRGLSVLYADDHTEQAAQLLNHLAVQAPHIRVERVDSAAAALARLRECGATGGYDVLLLAFDLPDVDGLELVRLIREDLNIRQPTILIAPQGNEVLAASSLYLGLDAYLSRHEGFLFELTATLEKVHRQAQLEREESRLREVSGRLTRLLASSPTLLYSLDVNDPELRSTWVSDNIERVLGFTPDCALERGWWWSHLHPDDRAAAAEASSRLLECGAVTHEYRFADSSGNYRWMRDELRVVKDEKGKPIEVVGAWNDISPEKRAENVRMARAMALDQLVALRPLAEILLNVAQRLESIDARMKVSILLLDPHTGKLSNGASPSLPDYFCEAVEGLEPGLGVGSCGSSAWLGEMVIVEDTLEHPYWAQFRELVLRSGLRACWSVPFMDDLGKVIGTFAVYHDSPTKPGDEQVALIKEFAGLTALAVQKGRAAEALRQSAAVLESMRDGVIITDLAGRIVSVNRAYCEITGFERGAVVGRNPSMSRSGRHDRAFYQAMWESLLHKGYWQGEIWNRRSDGEVYPQWLSLSTVSNEAGERTHYVGVMTDLSQIKRSEALLERLSHYDPLTDLPNRLLVLSRLDHAIGQAERHGHMVGVLYVDLDRFKNVNDSLGHPVGDEVLVEVARRLKQAVRREDTLARLGGDEFLVVIDDLATPEDAATLARKIIAVVGAPVTVSSGQEVVIGASVGISLYPNDGDSATQLIQHSDTALYRAKDQGRNTLQFYLSELTLAANHRLEMELQLRRALERGEFRVFYQPLLDFKPQSTEIGAEALIRWIAPGRGVVSPVEFIPLAEETGLIVAIGEWVLREACRQAQQWRARGLPFGRIAVNLSARQFHQPGIVALVAAVLAETGLPAGHLELEITESALMADLDETLERLDALRALGVTLAVDDFGTGYSSLAYLNRFPLDKLKIDQSFVRGMAAGSNEEVIVRATIAMAHSMGLRTLAEGVETEAQHALLAAMGCDAYQGFIVSPPVASEDFERLEIVRSGAIMA